MMRGRVTRRHTPEVHVFLLWSEARVEEERILADLAERFRVLDVVEVVWTQGDSFADSLSRMYGDALPPGSDKERHCGSGPFLVVVVEDALPRYGVRRTSRRLGVVNTAVFDARQRYREWTGGGFRVHASDSVLETERNLLLLFGTGSAEVLSGRPASEPPRRREVDPVGTNGWESLNQLGRVIRPYGGHLRPVASPGEHEILASDPWWVERIVGGREVAPGTRLVEVAGSPLRFRVSADDGPGIPSQLPPLARAADDALSRTTRLVNDLLRRQCGGNGPGLGFTRPVMELLTREPWAYPRPRTTIAVCVVTVTTTVVGRSLLPAERRRSGTGPTLVASSLSYVVLRAGVRSGWTKHFKHTVMDRLGGDVDDAHTWILATFTGCVSLLALDAVLRVMTGRRAVT